MCITSDVVTHGQVVTPIRVTPVETGCKTQLPFTNITSIHHVKSDDKLCVTFLFGIIMTPLSKEPNKLHKTYMMHLTFHVLAIIEPFLYFRL